MNWTLICSLVVFSLLNVDVLVTFGQGDSGEQNIQVTPYYFVIIIAVALISPVIIDQVLSYHKGIIQNKPEAPTPMSGLYRALMTFGVILLVCAVVFYILGILTSSIVESLPNTINSMTELTRTINESNLPAPAAEQMVQMATRNSESLAEFNSSMLEIVKNIAIVLGGAVSAIIGFYFGNKAATEYGDKVMAIAEGRLRNGGEGKSTGGDQDHGEDDDLDIIFGPPRPSQGDSDTSVEELGEDRKGNQAKEQGVTSSSQSDDNDTSKNI